MADDAETGVVIFERWYAECEAGGQRMRSKLRAATVQPDYEAVP